VTIISYECWQSANTLGLSPSRSLSAAPLPEIIDVHGLISEIPLCHRKAGNLIHDSANRFGVLNNHLGLAAIELAGSEYFL
jgi:hypothetical protein